MDIADKADIEIDRDMKREIKRIQQSQVANNVTECIDCGIIIPPKRKELIPSCTRCVECEVDNG